jgi:hypothetical protein
MDKEERQQATLRHHKKEKKHRQILQQETHFLASLIFQGYATVFPPFSPER